LDDIIQSKKTAVIISQRKSMWQQLQLIYSMKQAIFWAAARSACNRAKAACTHLQSPFLAVYSTFAHASSRQCIRYV